jgi:hypothetical protein
MHWRRFRIDSIPINNSKAFEVWLRNRWREKDYMLEYFNRNNRFPADDFWKEHLDMDSQSSTGGKTLRTVPRPAIQIETEVKSGNWNEFVKIFAPITSVIMALTVAYGASPNDLPFPGGKEFLEQHMKALLSGGEMKGLPSPDELEKLIVGAAKLGKGKTQGDDADKVQELTQENLAKLVKETAIKNGMVLPGGMRRVNSALPALTATPRKAGSVVAKPTAEKAKSAVNMSSSAKRPTLPAAKTAAKAGGTTPAVKSAKVKPAPSGEMQNVMTKSGVMIKIPKSEVEEAKTTGTVVTKNGLVIKIRKDEMDEAQKKKGTTVMTAGGIPIKITQSGAMTVEQKPGSQAQAQKAKVVPKNTSPMPAPALSKGQSMHVPVRSAANPNTAAKTVTRRDAGPQIVTRKSLTMGNNVSTPASTTPKTQTPKLANKKTAV